MKNQVESLLEDDHSALGQLLSELKEVLARSNLTYSFELLDLFWARLAVHIRAENLHLFPALTNLPSSLFTGSYGQPTSQEAHNIVARLRSDHDFFMKELAVMIKTMREMKTTESAPVAKFDELRQSLTVIADRLNDHNRLEEQQVYVWPSLLLEEPAIAELRERLRHELQKVPARFVISSAADIQPADEETNKSV